MSEQPTNGSASRTLAIRVSEELRAQLDIVAQINNRSTTAEIIVVLQDHVDKIKSDPKILAKAQEVQQEIERKAAAQQAAIASIFGNSASPGESTPPKDAGEASATPRSPGRRGGKPVGD